MAGKTKRSGTPKHGTPRGADLPGKGQLGHMGLKSSPYAPTDCKLVNQYMILDRMQAHYKKLNKTKAAVDTSAPKAWLVSQKLRDAARREAMAGSPRKSARYGGGLRSSRPGSVTGSEDERDQMFAMMESISHMEDGDLDELDGHRPPRAGTSMEIHHSDSSTYNHLNKSDMRLVNQMVNDQEHSPSKYHTGKVYRSNIPAQHHTNKSMDSTRMVAQKPLYKTQVLETYHAHPALAYTKAKPTTPRSADVLDQHGEKFTEEKPFQPRTLKSNRKSKLSEFKYYTPPKRKDNEDKREEEAEGAPLNQSQSRPQSSMSNRAPSMRASLRSRPGTANTLGSTDWMNETIVSRDHTERDTPSGVPALDISIDQDHFKWIKEQQTKAQLRISKSPHSTLGSTRGADLAQTGGMNGTLGRTGGMGSLTLNGTMKETDYDHNLDTTRQIREEEEELKYLQFIQDVTNDVLDRGIFTNRVLKVVFESHVDRRKHELKVRRMREMLEDLRVDLGIPLNDDEDKPDGFGLTSTWHAPYSPRAANPRVSRRSKHEGTGMSGTIRPGTHLPNLHQTVPPRRGGRTPSPEGKPPLPRPNSRGGSRGAQSPSPSRSTEFASSSKDSVFDTVTVEITKSADILTIEHEEPAAEAEEHDALNGNSTLRRSFSHSDEEEDQAALYQRQLADTIDDDERGSLSGSDTARKTPVHSDNETPRDNQGNYTPVQSESEMTPRKKRTPKHSESETPRDGKSGVNTPRSERSEKHTSRSRDSSKERARSIISNLSPAHSVDDTSVLSGEDDPTLHKNLESQAGEIIKSARSDASHSEMPPKPTPRERRRKASEIKDSARSLANTTTDTLDVSVSELDSDQNDSF